jgi:uncharacterized lipoprotein YajG
MRNLIIIAFILLTGCNAQKQCDKAYAKATKLGCISRDTIVKYVTVKGFRIDTFVQYSEKREIDTLLVDSGGIKVKTIIKWNTRTVFQEVLKKDTVVETIFISDCPKLVPHKLTRMQEFWMQSGKYTWFAIVMASVFLIFIRYFKK